MNSFALAWRTAQRYRARTMLAIAGVAVIGALLFDMLLLSRGLLLSFAEMIDSAGFDVRVIGGTGLPGLRLPVTGAAKLADDVRQRVRRRRDHREVGNLRQLIDLGEARPIQDCLLLGVDQIDLAGEAPIKDVLRDLAAHRARFVAGADNGERARPQCIF